MNQDESIVHYYFYGTIVYQASY